MNRNIPYKSDAIRFDAVKLSLSGPAGEVPILRGVDLAVKYGETLGVTGPSGSGKSTLMMVAAGLEQPSEGRVAILGEDITNQNEDQLASFRRRNVGIVFQAFHLAASMSALENVALPLDLAGEKNAAARAEEMLKLVGLGHRLGHYPSQLSGGEQQRVAIARAFVAKPRLILADEPTGNLDQNAGRAVMDLLFSFVRDMDATMLLITHDPSLAERCSGVIRIEDGRIASDNRKSA